MTARGSARGTGRHRQPAPPALPSAELQKIELRVRGVCHGPQPSATAPLKNLRGERQRWECCPVASQWGGGHAGLQRKAEAIHSAATQHAFLGHLNLFTHLNAVRSAAGTSLCLTTTSMGLICTSQGSRQGTVPRLRPSSLTRALMQQRGNCCPQRAGANKSFCNWLKKPYKPPDQHRHRRLSAGSGQRDPRGRAAAQGRATEWETRCKKKSGLKMYTSFSGNSKYSSEETQKTSSGSAASPQKDGWAGKKAEPAPPCFKQVVSTPHHCLPRDMCFAGITPNAIYVFQ